MKMTSKGNSPLPKRRDISYIKRFREIGIEDIPQVGGKNASLGEMFRELSSKGVKVPDGFAITAAGYWHFLRDTGLDAQSSKQLVDLDASEGFFSDHSGFSPP